MIVFKIGELMGKHKLTKKAVADMTGIHPNTVSALWYGEVKRLDVEHIDKLCKLFNCQPGDLMEYILEPVEPNKQ